MNALHGQSRHRLSWLQRRRIDLRVWWRWRFLSWWKACDGCGRRGHPKRSAIFGGGRLRPEQYCDFNCDPSPF